MNGLKRFSDSESSSELLSPSPECSSDSVCKQTAEKRPESSKPRSSHPRKNNAPSATPLYEAEIPRSRITLSCQGDHVVPRRESLTSGRKNPSPKSESPDIVCTEHIFNKNSKNSHQSRVKADPQPHFFTDYITGQPFFLKHQNTDDIDNPIEVRWYELSDPDPVTHVYLKGGLKQGGHLVKKAEGDYAEERYNCDCADFQLDQSIEQFTPIPTEVPSELPCTHVDILNIEESTDSMATVSSAVNPLVPGASSAGGIERNHEKENLQELNTRLSMYITHVRQIRENAHKVDSSAFLESVRILEDELINLKDIYDKELQNTRKENEEVKKMKNQLALEITKTNGIVSDLETKLADERERNRKSLEEINVLRQELMNKDQDFQKATHAIRKPTEDLQNLQIEFNALSRDHENVKKRHETEQLHRQEAEDRVHLTEQNLDFQKKVHEEEVKDLNNRLHVASNTILELENRIREYAIADTSLQEMMQRVRTVAENELKRYQEESSAAFNQSLSELKSQLDTSVDKEKMLTQENEKLHEDLGNAMAHIRDLQTQIAGLVCQRNAAEDLLNNERLRAKDNMEALERKLHSLQDLLVSKMREVNAAREAQIPLRNEIESFKSLVEEEERRLRLPPTFHNDAAIGAPGLVSKSTVSNNLNSVQPSSSSQLFNGLLTDPQARVTQPALGPVRARSAPDGNRSKANLVPTSLGQGRDYFDELFKDLKINGDHKQVPQSNTYPQSHLQPLAEPPTALPQLPPAVEAWKEPGDRPLAMDSHDYTTATSSSTGDIRIMEIHPEGKYIRLHNTSTKDDELGSYMIQQNVGGHPVAVFRFPQWVRFPANATATVWAGCSDPLLHQPPSDFVFKEQFKWGTGPECTTILCKPNNQAVAWTTAAHRFTPDAYLEGAAQTDQTMGVEQPFPEYNMDVNAKKPAAVYLRRKKETPPSLNAPKHPHGQSTGSAVHPSTGQPRPKTYGNDNSSVNRQSRVQTTTPAPIPGAPYAGASAQRMGSASLRKSPSNMSKNASGALANNAAPALGTETSQPPSAFQKPHARIQTGIEQIESQHNLRFQPPMPRPPHFATW